MVRSVREADIPACTAIYNHYITHSDSTFETEALSSDAFGARVTSIADAYPYLVYEDDCTGEILGYAYLNCFSVRQAYRFTCDLSIYVRQDAHRQGIGHRLYAAIERLAYRQGFYSIISVITDSNEESMRFHSREGFCDIGGIDRIACKFGRWIGIRYYRKILRTPNALPDELLPPAKDYKETDEIKTDA